MTKIKLVSDLHLEFSDIVIPNNGCDVLVLAGDILVTEDLYNHKHMDYSPYTPGALAELGRSQIKAARSREFLKRVSDSFPHVIYVAGNHEFYHGKWFKTIDVLREECGRFPNVHFLECDTKKINDVTFIGGTLWSDMNNNDPLTLHAVRDMMNDYRCIRNDRAGFVPVKPADTVVRHKKTLGYIQTVIEGRYDEKFVVVGHHSPCSLSIPEKFKNDHLMNGAYSSDLSNFILDHPQIKLWFHGHTHDPFDYVVGETRIMCNPRGYHTDNYSEDTGWDPDIIIEI